MKYKYTIELSVRGKGVQLIKLNEEEKDEVLEEDLDEVFCRLIGERDFELERVFLMRSCDRYCLTIKDEQGNIVYESTNVCDLLDKDKTYDDGKPQVAGWEFRGVNDGIYLTRLQTIKGCRCTGEFELGEPFDKEKLYVLQDMEINDKLMGDDASPIDKLYYQRGDGYDIERDSIDLDFESDYGEQFVSSHVLKLGKKDCWTDL